MVAINMKIKKITSSLIIYVIKVLIINNTVLSLIHKSCDSLYWNSVLGLKDPNFILSKNYFQVNIPDLAFRCLTVLKVTSVRNQINVDETWQEHDTTGTTLLEKKLSGFCSKTASQGSMKRLACKVGATCKSLK